MKHQREIMAYLRTVESANLQDIYKNVSFSYYCNVEKHLGAILSRMVNAGMVERIKPGLFKIGNGKNPGTKHVEATQPTLF